MNKIYLATKLIGDAYATQIQNQTEEVQAWLVHKLKHTFCVAHDIMDILFNEKELWNTLTPNERELVELSAILHDLGRFYQHRDGHKLSSTEFDHGVEAVKLLRDNPDFNNPMLLFAIEEHNRFKIRYDNPYYVGLSEHDKFVADQMAKLLRDADKLENIKDFVYHGVPKLYKFPTKEPLSEKVKEAITKNEQVLRANMKTSSDRVVDFLAWVYDINFKRTKDIIFDLGFIEKGIEEAGASGATAEDCELLRKYLRF